jgi:hypothetical protein
MVGIAATSEFDPTPTLGGIAVLLAPAAPGLVFNRKGQFRRVT